MGSCDFYETGIGKDVDEAFDKAVKNAQYESGHGGYTGTIAEKNEYIIINYKPPHTLPRKEFEYAEKLISEDDKRINNKWGPAGAIRLAGKSLENYKLKFNSNIKKDEEVWLFFGWASC